MFDCFAFMLESMEFHNENSWWQCQDMLWEWQLKICQYSPEIVDIGFSLFLVEVHEGEKTSFQSNKSLPNSFLLFMTIVDD